MAMYRLSVAAFSPGANPGMKPLRHRHPVGPSQDDLDDETDADDGDHEQRQQFKETHAAFLQGQQQERVAAGDQQSP